MVMSTGEMKDTERRKGQDKARKVKREQQLTGEAKK
jgi:hypothetical protein